MQITLHLKMPRLLSVAVFPPSLIQDGRKRQVRTIPSASALAWNARYRGIIGGCAARDLSG